MKKNILFDCNKAYEFGMTKEESEIERCVYECLSGEDKKILDQVIEYAKNALFSRFSDYVYETSDQPHFEFKLKGRSQIHHIEMIKGHKLRQADLPEFIEDMIDPATFVRTELSLNKKGGIVQTAFVFEDMIKFEDDAEFEKIELKFSLNKVVKGVYHMNILAFGKPFKREQPRKKVKKKKPKYKVSVWP